MEIRLVGDRERSCWKLQTLLAALMILLSVAGFGTASAFLLTQNDVLIFSLPVTYPNTIDMADGNFTFFPCDPCGPPSILKTTLFDDDYPGILFQGASDPNAELFSLVDSTSILNGYPWHTPVDLYQFNDGVGLDRLTGIISVEGAPLNISTFIISFATAYDSHSAIGRINQVPDSDMLIVHVPVPEPSTLLLLASGVAGLGGMTWRRHRK